MYQKGTVPPPEPYERLIDLEEPTKNFGPEHGWEKMHQNQISKAYGRGSVPDPPKPRPREG